MPRKREWWRRRAACQQQQLLLLLLLPAWLVPRHRLGSELRIQRLEQHLFLPAVLVSSTSVVVVKPFPGVVLGLNRALRQRGMPRPPDPATHRGRPYRP